MGLADVAEVASVIVWWVLLSLLMLLLPWRLPLLMLLGLLLLPWLLPLLMPLRLLLFPAAVFLYFHFACWCAKCSAASRVRIRWSTVHSKVVWLLSRQAVFNVLFKCSSYQWW